MRWRVVVQTAVCCCSAGALYLVALPVPPAPLSGSPEGPSTSSSCRQAEMAVELVHAGPGEREALARRLSATGGTPGQAILPAYSRLPLTARVRAIRLLYDYDRPALRASWTRFLQDDFPQVVALTIDLLVESRDPQAVALLLRNRPSSPPWLVAHWERQGVILQSGRRP